MDTAKDKQCGDQSPANQVWGIGHLRESVLDDCAELYSSPVERAKFFRKCITRLDKASVRECARHTHASVHLDQFPWDCPDSDRLRWYAMGVKRLKLQGALPLCHQWTLTELLEQFPNAEEIEFPHDAKHTRYTTLYRSGHPECCVPGVPNFITHMSLSPARLPEDRFVAPEDFEHVHFCDIVVIPDVFDMDTLAAGNLPSISLNQVLMSWELPSILQHPIRWLSFETTDGMMDASLWTNIFRVRKHHRIPTLGIDTGSVPQYCNYFNVISEAVGSDLRWVRMHEMEWDLGAVFDVFTEAKYPKLEEINLNIEPGGDFGSPITEPLPPNLSKIHIDFSVYTFTLNQPESSGLFPEQRLPLKTLRRLKAETGPNARITARVVTNAYSEGPRLQALVDEALA